MEKATKIWKWSTYCSAINAMLPQVRKHGLFCLIIVVVMSLNSWSESLNTMILGLWDPFNTPCLQWGKGGFGTVNTCKWHIFIYCTSRESVYMCVNLGHGLLRYMRVCMNPTLPTVRQGGIGDNKCMQITYIYALCIYRKQWMLLNNRLTVFSV